MNWRIGQLQSQHEACLAIVHDIEARSAAIADRCAAVEITLGSRLNHSQNATAAARLTAERKFLASLSYRVAMRRKSLRRQNMASTRQRSL